MTTTDTTRDELDDQAVALMSRATELHYLARDYAANESTRQAERHNGAMWVKVGQALRSDLDVVLRELDSLATACRDLPSFPAGYAVIFATAARAARAALDALTAYPVED